MANPGHCSEKVEPNNAEMMKCVRVEGKKKKNKQVASATPPFIGIMQS